MYGISIDDDMGTDKFEYLIADDYNHQKKLQKVLLKVIPKHTWAVFLVKTDATSFARRNQKDFQNGYLIARITKLQLDIV